MNMKSDIEYNHLKEHNEGLYREIDLLGKQLAAELKSRSMWQDEAHKVAQERDQLKAQLETAFNGLEDAMKERNQALAACAEMRELLNNCAHSVYCGDEKERKRLNTPPCPACAWEKLNKSTTCGRGWFNAEKLKPIIEKLEHLDGMPNERIERAVIRLKALVPPIK